jgi:CIC family chloride channel protein
VKPASYIMAKKPLNLFMLSLVSILVGIIAGCGAILFRGLIGFFHNLFFLGIASFSYDANQHTPPGPWGPYIILAPVIGAVVVSFLITKFAPEAKGHGVPEVMEATFYNKGLIRPVVAVVKAVASALSIGTGGSVGREGPIIQIGSSFGSTISQIMKLPPWQTITLIAAGGGGGIAATFNTPVGGILFAVELLMHEVSARTLIPVVISTVTATYIGQAFFGTHPSFVIPAIEIRFFQLQEPAQLLLYVVLGGIIGVASAVFIKSIYWTEHLFDRIVKKNYYVRHMLGMFLVGVIFYLLKVGYGHYYVEGVGYAAVQDILSGALTGGVVILLLLFALKLVVTSLTLGSGGSGGIFSPSLFLGATIGLCYGILLKHLLPPGFYINSRAYAVAGMAGMVGGVTGAALMSIIMIFEMTLDYSVIVPMVITVIISYGIRKTLSKESIYTLKLTRRGHHVPGALKVDFTELRQARDIMDPRVRTAPSDMKLKDFALFVMEQKDAFWFIVEQEGKVIGILSRLQALQAIGPEGGESEIGQIANKNFAVIRPGQMVLDVDKIMSLKNVEVALVSEKEDGFKPEDVEGVVTIERVKWAIGEFEMLPK